MQFSAIVRAAALVASVSAVSFTQGPSSSVAVGSPQTIAWDNSQPAELILDQANSNGVQVDVSPINSAATSPFTWTPDASIANGAGYTIKIRQAGQTNFWVTFSVTGGSSASKSSSAPATSSTGSVYGTSTATKLSSSTSVTAASASTTAVKPSGNATVPVAPSATRAKSNGTISSPTLAGSPKSTPVASPSGVPANSSGASATFGGTSIALLAGIVAAMAYLN